MSEQKSSQQRRYVRIPSIIPVRYQLLAGQAAIDSEVRVGFTRDLSSGGMCLRAYALPPALVAQLTADEVNGVRLDVDLHKRTVRLEGRIAWSQPSAERRRESHLIGVEFQSIGRDDAAALERFARRMARRPAVVRAAVAVTLALLLAAVATLFGLNNSYLKETLLAEKTAADVSSRYRHAADEIGDANVELRWLNTEVSEMLQQLDGSRPRLPADKTATPLEELSSNVQRLKAVVTRAQPALLPRRQ
jgi:hypothetical protein